MSLFHEIRESLRPSDHPADRLAARVRRRGETSLLDDTPCVAVISTILVMVPAWLLVLFFPYLIAFEGDGPEPVGYLASLSYIMLLLPAFLAPSLGARIRARFDRSPLLPELLTTPIPAVEYLLAIVRRGLAFAVLSACLYACLAGAMLYAAEFMGFEYRDQIAERSLAGYVFVAHRDLDESWLPLPLAMCRFLILLAALTCNYGAGVWLRTLQLARFPQLSAASRIKGGFETARLLFLLGVGFSLRLVVYDSLVMAFAQTGLLLLALCELMLAGSRLARARRVIDRMEFDMEYDFTEHVLGESVVRPPNPMR